MIPLVQYRKYTVEAIPANDLKIGDRLLLLDRIGSISSIKRRANMMKVYLEGNFYSRTFESTLDIALVLLEED